MSALNLYQFNCSVFKLSIEWGQNRTCPLASRLTDSQRTAIKNIKSELLFYWLLMNPIHH